MTRFLFAVVLIALLALSGCCTQTCRDAYKPALDQWHENLTDSVRPALKKALADGKLPPELQESKLGVLDRTIQGIDRVRGAGPEAWKGAR